MRKIRYLEEDAILPGGALVAARRENGHRVSLVSGETQDKGPTFCTCAAVRSTWVVVCLSTSFAQSYVMARYVYSDSEIYSTSKNCGQLYMREST